MTTPHEGSIGARLPIVGRDVTDESGFPICGRPGWGMGCEERIENTGDLYRCAQCDVAFHGDCLRLHFGQEGRLTLTQQERAATMEREAADALADREKEIARLKACADNDLTPLDIALWLHAESRWWEQSMVEDRVELRRKLAESKTEAAALRNLAALQSTNLADEQARLDTAERALSEAQQENERLKENECQVCKSLEALDVEFKSSPVPGWFGRAVDTTRFVGPLCRKHAAQLESSLEIAERARDDLRAAIDAMFDARANGPEAVEEAVARLDRLRKELA